MKKRKKLSIYFLEKIFTQEEHSIINHHPPCDFFIVIIEWKIEQIMNCIKHEYLVINIRNRKLMENNKFSNSKNCKILCFASKSVIDMKFDIYSKLYLKYGYNLYQNKLIFDVLHIGLLVTVIHSNFSRFIN